METKKTSSRRKFINQFASGAVAATGLAFVPQAIQAHLPSKKSTDRPQQPIKKWRRGRFPYQEGGAQGASRGLRYVIGQPMGAYLGQCILHHQQGDRAPQRAT